MATAAAGALLPSGELRSRDAVFLAQPSLTPTSGLGARMVCCVCMGCFLRSLRALPAPGVCLHFEPASPHSKGWA